MASSFKELQDLLAKQSLEEEQQIPMLPLDQITQLEAQDSMELPMQPMQEPIANINQEAKSPFLETKEEQQEDQFVPEIDNQEDEPLDDRQIMLNKYKDLIKRYEDVSTRKPESSEDSTMNWLTAIGQAASNLVPQHRKVAPVQYWGDLKQSQETAQRQQELENLGKLQGSLQGYLSLTRPQQSGLTEYQKAMLGLQKQRQDKSDVFLKQRQSEQQRIENQQQINTIRGMLKDDPIYKQVSQQSLEFDSVKDILDSAKDGNQAAVQALGTKLARAMGEQGVLTDADVIRYVKSTSWGRTLNDWAKRGFDGSLSKETIKDIRDNIETIENKLNQNREKIFNRAADRVKSAYPDLEKEKIYGILGYTPQEQNSKKESDIDPKIQEYADKYKLNYQNAKRVLESRGYTSGE